MRSQSLKDVAPNRIECRAPEAGLEPFEGDYVGGPLTSNLDRELDDPFWRAHAELLAARIHAEAMCDARSEAEQAAGPDWNTDPEVARLGECLSQAFEKEYRALASLARTPTYGAEQARILLEIALPIMDEYGNDFPWGEGEQEECKHDLNKFRLDAVAHPECQGWMDARCCYALLRAALNALKPPVPEGSSDFFPSFSQ